MAVEDVPQDKIINVRKSYFQVLYYIPLRDLYRWDDRYDYMAAIGYIPVEGQTIPPTLPPGPGSPFNAAETQYLDANYASDAEVQQAKSDASSALGIANNANGAAGAAQSAASAAQAAAENVEGRVTQAASAASNASSSAASAQGAAADALTAASRSVRSQFGYVKTENALNAFGMPTTDDNSSSVVAIGRGSMAAMTDIKFGIAIGKNAQGKTKISRDNIALGDAALFNIQAVTSAYDQSQQTGTRCVAIGGNALYFTNQGYGNVGIGRNAGQSVVDGTGLVAIGINAVSGFGPIGFSGEIENGNPWGAGPDGTIYTCAVGNRALMTNLGLSNVGIGGYALMANKKSEGNTAVGAQALQSLDTNSGNHGGQYVAIGANGTYSQTDKTLTLSFAAHGLVVGDLAYIRLLDGDAKTFQFDAAFASVQSVPDANTFVVTVPKSFTTGGNALLVAKETQTQQALNSNNSAFGNLAGSSQQAGGSNTYLGQRAATATLAGDQNVAVGTFALGQATNIGNCTAVGFYAAGSQTGNSSRVVAIGASALRNRVDGTAMTDEWSNIGGIGYDSRVSGANQLALGNSTQTVYSQSAVQTRSDARDKADICPTELGLENFILKLKPSQWRWDRREDYTITDDLGEVVEIAEKDGSKKGERFHQGFIAQDVQKVIKESGIDFGGFQDHKIAGGSDVYSLGYEEFIAPMVNAIQELHGMVESLKAEVADLKGKK